MSAYPPNPVPPPLPLSPLEYSELSPRGRPGLVTAIGVLSIVVACISGLVSLWGTMMAMGLMMMAGRAIPVPVPPPPRAGVVSPASPGAAAPNGTVTIGGVTAPVSDDEQDGMVEPQRKLVRDFLSRRGGLDARRQKHLDVLLSAAGQKMFPTPQGTPLTPELIGRDITDFGLIPSADGTGGGTNYFVISTGRIEVYDDHALYRPDGSDDVVSARAPDEKSPADPSVTDPSAGDPSSSAVPPTPPTTTGATMSYSVTTVGPGGMTRVTTSGKRVPVRTVPLKLNAAAATASLAESALSLLLALLLFIAGVLVLRDSPRGATLHWTYVWIKIPLVIVAVVANAAMWSGFFNAFASAAAAGAPGSPAARMPGMGRVMLVWAMMAGGLALAYPIGLIFALRSRTVREYYNSVRGE
jgi:hypothetical protein